MAADPDPHKTGLALRIEFGVLLLSWLITLAWSVMTVGDWLA